MDVEHCLARPGIGIVDYSEAIFRHAVLPCNFGSNLEGAPNQKSILFPHFQRIDDMFPRYDQQVQRSDRRNILNDNKVFVFVDRAGGNLAGDNSAENTSIHFCPSSLNAIRDPSA